MPEHALGEDRLPSAHASPLPASPLACLPLFWSRVLFPGPSPATEPFRWRPFLLLLIVSSLLLLPRLSFPLFEPDEGRYAEIPREMLIRGEWVVPYLLDEPYLDKPPLLYWLVIGSYKLLGVHDWSARLVPALALQVCVLATYFLGRRSLGERPAFWGALVLSLAPGFMTIGRLLVLDGLLALWVTLAVLAAFEALRGDRLRWSWWLLAALACGLGILTKGPVVLVLLVPPVWAYRRLTRASWKAGWPALLAFAVVALGVALPWYVAVCLRRPDFTRYFLWQHNVVRFLSPFDHLRPVWFYVPIVLAGLLPATLLAIPFIRFLFTGDPEASRRRCPELGFLLLVGCWCLLFFSLSGSKLPTYVLPAFPPLALALGYYLAHSRWRQSRWPASLAAASFLLLAVGHHVVMPWYAWYRSPMSRPEEVARLCGDPEVPVICYPRHCDSVAFYLGRDDLRNYRSRDIELLRHALRQEPRTVVLCTHRHSLEGLRQALPPELCVAAEAHLRLGRPSLVPEWLAGKFITWMGETPLGLCDIAVIERHTSPP
jgi:4-amino-4-deoxy-L-arabinose transferase-like glycosyltransferase